MRGLPHASRIQVPVTVHYAGSVADASRILAGRVTAMADMARSELHAAKLMRANTCIVDVLEQAWQPRRSPREAKATRLTRLEASCTLPCVLNPLPACKDELVGSNHLESHQR